MSEFALSRGEVRGLDRRATAEFGVPSIVLMENAGRGAAELLTRLNPDREPVTILCGPGNNGGDGLVMARHLDNRGWTVRTLLCADPATLTPDAIVNFRPLERSGLVEVCHGGDLSAEVTSRRALGRLYPRAYWVVDALFGTGLNRRLAPPFDAVVEAVNEVAAMNPVLALDIPSGLDCDTGEPLGPTVRAAHTATFVAVKTGFLNPRAREYTGEVHVIDIGAPRALVDSYRNR